jgi:hypothetical protein
MHDVQESFLGTQSLMVGTLRVEVQYLDILVSRSDEKRQSHSMLAFG